ncbi:uncharacterized protein IUM83_11558 [Phytophthora cinnamomi]|uniref:uncharacterized protein n=1 Tax=Phytophthora cinnamomi TaxID=4785 RepID=UPI00355A2DEF|nr:hypothetical protein IUM83_11558 [Phytophthora cinnamomi]
MIGCLSSDFSSRWMRILPTETVGSHSMMDCSRLSPARMMDTAQTRSAGTRPVNESPVGVTTVCVLLAQAASPSSARMRIRRSA